MQNDSFPMVSVIIPTYNRAGYIAEAIESVLAQEYASIEIIVVDDGSTDNTRQVVAVFPEVRYVYQENRGQAAARNRAIAMAEGEWLAFVDSDDLWTPGRLPMQVRYLLEHPEIMMVFGGVEQFSSEAHRLLHEKSLKMAVRGMTLGTLLIRKSDFLRVGDFCTDLRVGEFVEWFTRATDRGYRYYQFSDIFLRRRLHDRNLGLQKQEGANAFASILKASLERRRRRSGE